MAVITLAEVKTYTTLTSSDDANITAMIPVIDSKVKQICGRNFNYQIVGKTTSGSNIVEVNSMHIDDWHRNFRGVNNRSWYEDIQDYLCTGMKLSGEGIESGSYITEIYSNGDIVTLSGTAYSIPVITMSSNASASNNSAEIFLGIEIGYLPTIAKGVQWLISQSSLVTPKNTLVSRRMGPLSESFSEKDQMIDGKSGMPSWFVKGLPRYHKGY